MKYIAQQRDHWFPVGRPQVFDTEDEARAFIAQQYQGRRVSPAGRVLADITWTLETDQAQVA